MISNVNHVVFYMFLFFWKPSIFCGLPILRNHYFRREKNQSTHEPQSNFLMNAQQNSGVETARGWWDLNLNDEPYQVTQKLDRTGRHVWKSNNGYWGDPDVKINPPEAAVDEHDAPWMNQRCCWTWNDHHWRTGVSRLHSWVVPVTLPAVRDNLTTANMQSAHLSPWLWFNHASFAASNSFTMAPVWNQTAKKPLKQTQT